ncbi:HAD family hydrolase [Azospirillum palustre]
MSERDRDTKIKAILFDMDGVLIDAREWHYHALNRALAPFGFEIGLEEHLAVYDGLPTRRKLQMLTKAQGLPTRLHPLINRLKQRYTEELAHSFCRPRFQHQYALARLSREGYRIAVCSNSIRNTVHLMMDRAGLSSYLEFFLSNEDVEKPKPDPEIYRIAAERMGVPPCQCLVVEDNQHGIEAARAAGTTVLAVTGVEEVTYNRIIDAIQAATSMAGTEAIEVL